MNLSAPHVSLCLPVYNGQRFLREAIDSLLAQTYGNFELIITDNGSTDQTEGICREYAAKDSRICYLRSPENRGPAWNFNRGVDAARGEYFKWAAADDVCDPAFLGRCIEVMARDPSVVLCYPQTRIIDEHGKVLEEYRYRLATDSPVPHERFRALVRVDHRRHGAFEIFGLMRASALRQTPLFERYARADSVLLVRLALLGRFHEVKEYLFYNRDHSDRSVRVAPHGLRRFSGTLARLVDGGPVPPTTWWNAAMKGRIVFPEWRLLREYFVSVGRASLNRRQRVCCYLHWTAFVPRHCPKLLRDLIIAARMVLGRRVRRPSCDTELPRDAPAPNARSAEGEST